MKKGMGHAGATVIPANTATMAAAAADVRAWVAQGACVYVCGSLRGMAPEVDATLDSILGTDLKHALLSSGRYRRDVY